MITATTYPTLRDALTYIAELSFYDSATVRRTGSGHWSVTSAVTPHDGLYWTYSGGIEYPTAPLDHSGLMEPCEYFSHAGNIEHYLPVAVEELNDGRAVTFSYEIITAYCECDLEPGAECLDEHDAGWALVATLEDTPAWRVLIPGGYADTPHDYVECAADSDMAAVLEQFRADYLGDSAHVFDAERDTCAERDPYPDYVVTLEADSVRWERA